MDDFKPEMMASRGYRDALAAMLTQFMHGEEISFTAVPLGIEYVRDEKLIAEVEKQLEDEKRHHKMFDSERIRLGLPREAPVDAMVGFYDMVIDKMNRKDIIGGIITGCFMLEGAAFSTLLTHSKVVDAELAATFKEIVTDEARHIALNIAVIQDMLAHSTTKMEDLVQAHRDALPVLFQLFTSFQAINNEMGIDNEWFTMRCLFHHSQRIRRLHVPANAAKAMLADTLAVASASK